MDILKAVLSLRVGTSRSDGPAEILALNHIPLKRVEAEMKAQAIKAEYNCAPWCYWCGDGLENSSILSSE